MAAAPKDPRQSIDYAWNEAARCADLAEKTGSDEGKAVYAALRESWTRIANSLESAETAAAPSQSKMDPEKLRYQLPTILKQTRNSSRGNSAVAGRSYRDATTSENAVTPSVAAALANAKWCVVKAAKATTQQRDTYLRLRDSWILTANEMQMLDQTKRAMLSSINGRRRLPNIQPPKS
jgi:hypothetical protein